MVVCASCNKDKIITTSLSVTIDIRNGSHTERFYLCKTCYPAVRSGILDNLIRGDIVKGFASTTDREA